MTDRLTPAQRSALMARIQGGPGNGVERTVHNWLKGAHVAHDMWPAPFVLAGVEVRPDAVAYPNGRPRRGRLGGLWSAGAPVDQREATLLVFVQGCMWHRCGLHYRAPRGENASYWAGKVAANAARDAAKRGAMDAALIRWVDVWEHDVRSGAFRAKLGAALHPGGGPP